MGRFCPAYSPTFPPIPLGAQLLSVQNYFYHIGIIWKKFRPIGYIENTCILANLQIPFEYHSILGIIHLLGVAETITIIVLQE